MTETIYGAGLIALTSAVSVIAGAILAYDLSHFVRMIRAAVAARRASQDVTTRTEKLEALVERRRIETKRVIISTLFLAAVVASTTLLSPVIASNVILIGSIANHYNEKLNFLLFHA